MFDIFGAEMPLAVRFFIAFIIVLVLIGATAYVVRRFGSDRLGGGAARGRQPRLAVIDAAAVDGRRRLVLIRRDNVEHLMMIGGPSDVVIEANIVRAAATQREAAPARPPAAPETLPRAVPLGEGNMWPLQPHPEPAPRPEPVSRMEPPPRPQRPPPPAPPPPQHFEELSAWPNEPEPPPPPPHRQARTADPLAGLAAELARTPAQHEPSAPPPRMPREREAPRAPQPSITDPQYNSNADQNLAEMAHRLEAALRRPGKGGEPRSVEPPMAHEEPVAEPPPPPRAVPAPENRPARAERSERVPRAEAKPAEAKPAPAKSVYDSLEQEMASLLGRPTKT